MKRSKGRKGEGEKRRGGERESGRKGERGARGQRDRGTRFRNETRSMENLTKKLLLPPGEKKTV